MLLAFVSSTKKRILTLKRHDEAVARWVSHVISPHIVGILLTAVVSVHYSANPWETLGWLAVLVPLIIVPPLAYVLWLVHIGSLEDIYMPRRESRMRPLLVMMLWLMVCLGLMHYWAAPRYCGSHYNDLTGNVGYTQRGDPILENQFPWRNNFCGGNRHSDDGRHLDLADYAAGTTGRLVQNQAVTAHTASSDLRLVSRRFFGTDYGSRDLATRIVNLRQIKKDRQISAGLFCLYRVSALEYASA